MDIKSLQIGDWFYDTLSQTDIKVNRGCFEINPLNGICYAENLIPIPLTAEILEKNGWRQDTYSNESWDNEEIDALSLWGGEDEKEDWWWHVGFELVTPIKYVHEFQQALRLCGIDKEIEL